MMFWDSSAIIPLCIDEPKTGIVREIAKKDPSIIAWWDSEVECLSAFARLRREKHLNDQEEKQVRDLLSLLSSTWTEIEASQEIKDMANRLLFLHPLQAADSLQLAAALIWAQKSPKAHVFVCLDDRLREAARKEGFTLLPTAM